jgi:hypothetical protein
LGLLENYAEIMRAQNKCRSPSLSDKRPWVLPSPDSFGIRAAAPDVQPDGLTPRGDLLMDQETKITKITDSLNREKLDSLPVVAERGGVQYVDYAQVMEAAKTMATARGALPEHLRGQLGDCLAIREMALNTGLSPWGLARHSLLVNGVLSYDGQAIHAIVERNAPLKQRLRFEFSGEGEEMRCTVVGHFKGEATPCVYTSPLIKQITPKNSPLWKTDPQQQLSYLCVRRWARRYCPDILLGIIAGDEAAEHLGPENAKDVSPNLLQRLPGRIEGAGFSDNIEQTLKESRPAARRKPKKVQAPGNSPPWDEQPDYETYLTHLRAWLELLSEGTAIIQHYEDEAPMRAGFVDQERKQLQAIVQARLESL